MKKLVAELDGIYVRSYGFAGEGEYSKADVEAVRAQLHAPLWARMVGVRSRHDHGDVDVYYKTADDGTIAGVVVLSAGPRELTIVSIAGTLNPHQLSELGGQFHIPRLDLTACQFTRRQTK
jgi:hypothetical protein